MTTPSDRRRTGEMNSRTERVRSNSSQTIVLALVVLAFVIYIMRWVLLPFVVAGLLAYVSTSLVDWLAAWTGRSRYLVAIAVFLVLASALVSFGLFGAPTLIKELSYVVTNMEEAFEKLARATIGDQAVTVFGQPMNAEQMAKAMVGGIRGWAEQTGRITGLAAIALAGIFSIFLTLVLFIYFVFSGPALMRGFIWLTPPDRRALVRKIWSRLDPVLKRYFLGVLAVYAYATAAAYLGLGLVLGIPHAGPLAFLTGVLETIPIIGPGTAAVVGGLIAMRYATGIEPIIAYAIYAAALRLSIDQIFGPLVLGTAAQLHPVLIIFCLVAGGLMFGVIGFFLAIPAALTTKVTLATLRDEPLVLDEATSEKPSG